MSTKDSGGPAMSCSKCGEQFIARHWQEKSRDYRCMPCKRAQQNAANAAKGQALRDEAKAAYKRRRSYYAAYWMEAKSDPMHKIKRAARRKVATEIEAGRLKRLPCEICGSEMVDAHHDDYQKPLDVAWLCHAHHMERHAMLKARAE